MNDRLIELARQKALNDRLGHENTTITILSSTPIRFKVDDRDIVNWYQELDAYGILYSIETTRIPAEE